MGRTLLLLILLMLGSGEGLAAPVSIRILHITDLHGFANPIKQPAPQPDLGGAARLAKQIAG